MRRASASLVSHGATRPVLTAGRGARQVAARSAALLNGTATGIPYYYPRATRNAAVLLDLSF